MAKDYPICEFEDCGAPAAWCRRPARYGTGDMMRLLCDEHQEQEPCPPGWENKALQNPHGQFAHLAQMLVEELRGAIWGVIHLRDQTPETRLLRLIELGFDLGGVLPRKRGSASDMAGHYANQAQKWLSGDVEDDAK